MIRSREGIHPRDRSCQFAIDPPMDGHACEVVSVFDVMVEAEDAALEATKPPMPPPIMSPAVTSSAAGPRPRPPKLRRCDWSSGGRASVKLS